MKQKLLFILSFLIIGLLETQAQSFCNTSAEKSQSKMSDYLHVNTASTDISQNFCLKINLHQVNRINGEGGIIDLDLNRQIDLLNNYFIGTGISFEGVIKDLNNDALFTDFEIPQLPNGNCGSSNIFDSFNPYQDSNAIDLYFFNSDVGGSIANGIADGTEIIFSKNAIDSPILAHEIGHVLGLFHTYHGTTSDACENNDGFSDVKECVNGTELERNTSGDYIADTVPDVKGDLFTTNCFQNGENDDACGDNYLPFDTDNFMAGFINCMNKFTFGQKKRMHYFLNNHLPSTIQDTCPPDSCEECENASARATQIFDQIVYGVNVPNDSDVCGITISYPNIQLLCGDGSPPPDTYEIRIDGNFVGTLGENEPNESNLFYATSPGKHKLNIKAFRNGEICIVGGDEFDFCTDSNCNEIDCSIGCDPTTCASLDASISIAQDGNSCPTNFVGTNGGVNCPTQTYLWTITNTNTGSVVYQTTQQNFDNTDFTFTESGTYEACFTIIGDSNDTSCIDTECSTFIISQACLPDGVNPCPLTPTISYTGNSSSCNYTFTANLGLTGYVDGVLSYDWIIKRNGIPIGDYDNSASISTQFNQGGIYNVSVTVSYREGFQIFCKTTTSIFVGCSSFGKSSESLNIKLYPNPTKTERDLQFEGLDVKDIFKVEIVDMLGNVRRVVKPKSKSFKVDNLKSGIYIFRFHTSKGIRQKKIIIE